MMAVLGALNSWQDEVGRHRAVLFADSDVVWGSFLKSWSANEDSDRLMDVIFDIEARFDLPVWIEQVLSQRNPADILLSEVVIVLGSAKRVVFDPWEMRCLVAEQPKPSDTPKAFRRQSGCGGSVTAISPLSKPVLCFSFWSLEFTPWQPQKHNKGCFMNMMTGRTEFLQSSKNSCRVVLKLFMCMSAPVGQVTQHY